VGIPGIIACLLLLFFFFVVYSLSYNFKVRTKPKVMLVICGHQGNFISVLLRASIVSWNSVTVKEGRLHVVRHGVLFFWAEPCRFISSLSAICAEWWSRSVCHLALCGAYVSLILHPCKFGSLTILPSQMFCNSYNRTACTLRVTSTALLLPFAFFGTPSGAITGLSWSRMYLYVQLNS
jgi:hypothetical protein